MLINFGAATLRDGCIASSTALPLPRLRVSQPVPDTQRFAASLTAQSVTMIPLDREKTLEEEPSSVLRESRIHDVLED